MGTQEELRNLRFLVAWTQHEGSGLGITWAETGELNLDDLQWLFHRVNLQREEEASAIRNARGSK